MVDSVPFEHSLLLPALGYIKAGISVVYVLVTISEVSGF